ncbi:MAG: hypothetical protein NXY57DRAFT_374198 [Lentinula lateritia]|nr:MAG: hypothetical protein NXY57DRAFT_374198 [Lentinula lateritia]
MELHRDSANAIQYQCRCARIAWRCDQYVASPVILLPSTVVTIIRFGSPLPSFERFYLPRFGLGTGCVFSIFFFSSNTSVG